MAAASRFLIGLVKAGNGAARFPIYVCPSAGERLDVQVRSQGARPVTRIAAIL
jgi:hypothetical protein